MNNFDTLSGDVMRHIANSMTIPDILNSCRISKKFNTSICNNTTFWRELVRTRYPEEYVLVFDQDTPDKMDSYSSSYLNGFPGDNQWKKYILVREAMTESLLNDMHSQLNRLGGDLFIYKRVQGRRDYKKSPLSDHTVDLPLIFIIEYPNDRYEEIPYAKVLYTPRDYFRYLYDTSEGLRITIKTVLSLIDDFYTSEYTKEDKDLLVALGLIPNADDQVFRIGNTGDLPSMGNLQIERLDHTGNDGIPIYRLSLNS